MAVLRRRRTSSSGTTTEAKQPSVKLWSIALASIAAVTAAGIIVSVSTGSASTPAPSPSPASHAAAPHAGKQRMRVEHGVPVGYPRTKAGAKAAAANYTTVSGSADFLTDETARHQAVSVMTSDDATEAVTKKADHAAGKAANPLRGDNSKIHPGQAIARTGVLSARLLGFDTRSAMVRLWTTAVRGSAKGHAMPKASFHAVTVTLAWESGDWKLKHSATTRGLVAPVDDRQASNVTKDFADYIPAAAEDPVASGVAGKDGFPADYARSERGARAAATSAVMLYGDPRFFTDDGWRRRMLAATAAPEVRESVSSDADSTARLVMENRGLGSDGKTAGGSQLITRTAALATRQISYSDRAASIELWTASVGGLAGTEETQRPQIAFLRMTVDLTWSHGTWRTTSVTPSEPLVPSPPASEEASPADRFAEVGGVRNAPATA